MHRTMLIAKRDYLVAVRTKAFLIGLVFLPLMFGGGFLVIGFTRGNVNVDRHVAILDRTGIAAPAIIQAAEERNRREMYNKLTGRQEMPHYLFEPIQVDAGHLDEQRLQLSNRVRRKELFAFLEIEPDAIYPRKPDTASVGYFTDAGGLDTFQEWMTGPVNHGIERVRLEQLGLAGQSEAALTPVTVEGRTLAVRDPKNGTIQQPTKKDRIAGIAGPYIIALLLLMIVLFGSATMLSAVAEDKLQRVFEMLLVSATPFELMAGKVLAAVGRSLTASVFYVVGAILALEGLALIGLAPMALLPWFFVFLIAEVVMISAIAIALGAACGSPQDAQSLNQFVVFPVMVPIFLMAPILQQPNGTLATVLSLVPPLTPVLMLLRQAVPGGVPAWQPWAGLVGVLACAFLVTWGASRIFRVAILFQGAAPKINELVRWAARG